MSECIRALVREPRQVNQVAGHNRVLQAGTHKLRPVLRRPNSIIFPFLLWPLCSFQLVIVGWPDFQSFVWGELRILIIVIPPLVLVPVPDGILKSLR